MGLLDEAIKEHLDLKRRRGADPEDVREMVEWNLPPIVFESAGTPGFFLNWLRPAIFGAALWTDPGKTSRKNYGSIGTQADLRFSVLHWYETVLSFGFAIGLQGTKRVGSEWMISLKIM